MEEKIFKIGSKTQEQFFSELTDEANAEAIITDLLSESSTVEDMKNLLNYLDNK